MHCQCIAHFGKPLVGQDRDDLVPKGSEVILDILAAGVCHTDLHVREGGVDLGHGQRLEYAQRGVALPKTLGHENVGRVVAVGPDVVELDTSKNYAIYPWGGCGACPQCLNGDENLCATPRFLGIHADGGYATQVRVPHPRHLLDIGHMDPQFAAPLACSGLTTYSALRKLGNVTGPVLVIGAGGLGLTCLQLMQALGMEAPVVADIDPAKREAALAAGARAVVDPRATSIMADIAEACNGAPHAVIDFVGAEPTAKMGFDAIAKGGTLVTVGLFGGAAPWALPMITLKSVRIIGSYVGSLPEFAELIELARKGAIKPIPSSTFRLDQADSVLNDLEVGKIIGRAILLP